MALDSRFIIASDLQEYFVDKDTGTPLAAGVVTFYKDDAPTELKPIYRLSGSPPNYSYTQLQNPVTLSAVGTFQDPNTGDDIVPYYFPLEGTPSATNGDVELYYVTVDSAGGVRQFTRNAWPNFTDDSSANSDFTNYIPNGQLLFHNDVPLTDTTKTPGEITAPITVLAQGGYTFEREISTTSKDIVLFKAFNSFETNPSASPKCYLQISTEIPSAGDAFKDLRIKFTDVNKFGSTTQKYTFAVTAESNTGSSLSASLILIKNFGTGGSPTTETPIANLTIPASYAIVETSGGFTFGDNTGKTIGPDSYLQLAIRFPTDNVFDVSLTDFVLTPDAVDINSFPQTTDREFSSAALTALPPASDGSHLYLPLKLTPSGIFYDDAEVGDVISESQLSVYVNSLHPTSNRMLADGSRYERAAYSPLGIPYNRLFNKYWNSTLNIPIYGTGAGYFIGVFGGVGNELRVTNNTKGLVTNAADGTTATTFTIDTIHVGSNTGYYCKAFMSSFITLYIENNEYGGGVAPTAGTSGFTVGTVQEASGAPLGGYSLLRQLAFVQTVAATGLAGTYFTFNTLNGGVDTPYYVWFKVDGAGSDPAIGGKTAIEVDLFSTDTATLVASKIQESLNGWQVTTIKTVAASSVPTGSYFSINSTDTSYYVWYKKDGTGLDPAPVGKTGIEVDIVSADTNTIVATKTQIAINRRFFATRDLRGQFLRGLNNGSGVDPDALTRYSLVPGIIGDTLGTLEYSQNIQHGHLYIVPAAGGTGGSPAGGQALSINGTEPEGGSESRPSNTNVNYSIIY